MPQRRFPRPWRFEPIPGGYRVIDANGPPLAHVYSQPPDAVAFSDRRLTDDEAEKLARLIVRLPELMELERERNKAKNRYHHLARSLSGISPGMGNSLRSSAWPADPPGTSISSHCHSDCRSGCRCRMWLIISSTASMVPGMTNSKGRYTRSRMREFQG
jgi:hypothetical protein